MRDDVTQLIAAHLHSLPHEDGRPRKWLHFSSFGKDDKTRAAIAILAKEHGECIQTLLERNGFSISHKDDPKPADADNYKQVSLKHTCGKKLCDFGCDDQLNAVLGNLALKNLAAAFTNHLEECR